jgi:hypothetical protein
MESLTAKRRYEEPSYIEEYAAELFHLKYSNRWRRLDVAIIIGKYFLLKPPFTVRRKSLGRLPPKAYYGAIPLAEGNLEWKLRLGPYMLREGMPIEPVMEDISRKLSEHGLIMKKGALESLIDPIFCSLRERYPVIAKTRECPKDYCSDTPRP